MPYNKTVYDKFGYAVDQYWHISCPDYNCNTEVVIVADASKRVMKYAKFRGVVALNPSSFADIKSGQVEFKHYDIDHSLMIMAYAPEIDTLFIRTLFDVKPTYVDPDDKLDIEARLGL